MRRDCFALWLPEALAEVLSVLYALGGVKESAESVLGRWLGRETKDDTDKIFEQWLDKEQAINGGKG